MFSSTRSSLISLFRVSPKIQQPLAISSQIRQKHEYAPRFTNPGKKHKGRVPIRTGGSIKGSTLQVGQYGLRLKSEGIRLAAIQLKEADNWLMRILRANGGKLIRRLQTNIAVCTKGNETRMGKGKGPFDYWAVRVPTGKILFEINAPNLHEQVARDAFRVASDKLPGLYEVVTLKDAPKAGFERVEPAAKEKVCDKMRENPNKRNANVIKSESEFYKMYSRR